MQIWKDFLHRQVGWGSGVCSTGVCWNFLRLMVHVSQSCYKLASTWILLRCIGPAEIPRALTVARFSRMNVSLAHFCQGFRGNVGTGRFEEGYEQTWLSSTRCMEGFHHSSEPRLLEIRVYWWWLWLGSAPNYFIHFIHRALGVNRVTAEIDV